MGNWGRTRDGKLLTPARRRLIRAYYARRPDPLPTFHQWTAKERTAYRKWRSGFMHAPKEHRYAGPPSRRAITAADAETMERVCRCIQAEAPAMDDGVPADDGGR